MGGPNDAQLDVCAHHETTEHELTFMEMALDAGFSMDTWKESMQPFGSTCYAASPRHVVIGSDGVVYKCTVAFNDPRNHVGQLDADGNLHLKDDLRLWTRSGKRPTPIARRAASTGLPGQSLSARATRGTREKRCRCGRRTSFACYR